VPAGAGELGAAWHDAVYDRVGNILMSRVLGAQVELVDEGFDIGIKRELGRCAGGREGRKGGKPYAIPAGASVHPLGGLGLSASPRRCAAQEKELGFRFDYIVVCTVTGSTHAGMVVGFAADGRAAQGDRHRRLVHAGRDQGAGAPHRAADGRAVGVGRAITADDMVLIEDYAYPAYGVPSAETTRSDPPLRPQLEGMITDPVYEGKSMQGMIDLVQRRASFPPARRCSTPISAACRRSTATATLFRNG
jgi:1-aminocyclopropane-1-carboxylate deaminase